MIVPGARKIDHKIFNDNETLRFARIRPYACKCVYFRYRHTTGKIM